MSSITISTLALVAGLVGSSGAVATNSSNVGGLLGASVAANLTTNFSVGTTSVSNSGYSLIKEYSGASFFDDWWFYNASTGADPTSGFVNYTDFWTTKEQELAGFIWDEQTNTTTAYIGVDHKTKAPNGRNAVRITSTDSFSNGGLFLADVIHTPLGICGTWPALWMTGPGWPNGGEIDIMEGVNDNTYNSMTLHTGEGCTTDNTGSAMLGKLENNDCYAYANGNAGCGVTAPYVESFNANNNLSSKYPTSGHGFNANHGGVYATLWTDEGISIYMFPRLAIPRDIMQGMPDPSSWTMKPLAKFAGSGCDFKTKFSELNLVVNTDFCGTWAGEVWGSSACAQQHGGSCNDFVANNPEAFKDAYWNIKSIKVYQTSGSMGTASIGTVSGNGTYKRDELSSKLPMIPRRADPVANGTQRAHATHHPHEETAKTSSSVTYSVSTDPQSKEHLVTVTATTSKHTGHSHKHADTLATLSTQHHPHVHANSKFVHHTTTTHSAQATHSSNSSSNATVPRASTSVVNITANVTHTSLLPTASSKPSGASSIAAAGWTTVALVLFLSVALM